MARQRVLPKHAQLSEMLIREIQAGRISDGSRLPTERQMAADLNVAVGTLRRALAILQEKGLLERIQGSGNYVRAKAAISSIYSFFRIELAEGGGLPTAEILTIHKLPKPVDAPFFGASDYGFQIRRLRRLNDQPIAVEEIWLDSRFTDVIDEEDVSDSLYLYYKETLDLVITKAQDMVSVGAVPDWAPAEADLTVGETAGYIERIGWDQHGDPAEFSKTWFNPTVARYAARLT